MSSSKGSNVYDDMDPMKLASDDEVVPEVQVITSDNELDDFQPFALLGDIIDDLLAIPPLLNEIVIMGHPKGEDIVEVVPFDVIPLDVIPYIIDLDDDDDIIPVIPVDHMDADLGDGEVHDVVILDVASHVVTVVGLHRYPDFGDDSMPDEPVIPTPVQTPTPPHTPVHAPTDEPIQAPISDGY
ncbi:hypothetical protein Hanom_Chr05g00408281 [Helianthus anomalus]